MNARIIAGLDEFWQDGALIHKRRVQLIGRETNRTRQVGAFEVSFVEISAGEVGLSQPGALQVGAKQQGVG